MQHLATNNYRPHLKCLCNTHGFDDLPGFNASGTNFLTANAAGGQLDTNVLKIWIEPPSRFVICVRDVVTEHRAFAANVTFFSHYYYASRHIERIYESELL